MLPIQIILVAFFIFAVIKAFLRYRANDLTLTGFIYWLLFWLAAAFIVIWPDATFVVANKLGIGRGADMIVYLALVVLFFSVFRLTARVEKQKKEITELTRVVALKNDQQK